MKRKIILKNGNVALGTVLIIGIVLSIGGAALILTTIDLSFNTKAYTNYITARNQNNNCMEEALYKVKLTPTFTGIVNYSDTNGTCSANVTTDTTYSYYKDVSLSGSINNYNSQLNKYIDTRNSPPIIKNFPNPCMIDYKYTSSTSTTTAVSLIITNLYGADTTSWTLSITMGANQGFTSGTNANFSFSSGVLTITNLSTNAVIADNSNLSTVSFTGTTVSGATPQPTAVTLNGNACLIK